MWTCAGHTLVTLLTLDLLFLTCLDVDRGVLQVDKLIAVLCTDCLLGQILCAYMGWCNRAMKYHGRLNVTPATRRSWCKRHPHHQAPAASP